MRKDSPKAMEFKHSIFKRKSKGDHRKGKWYLRLRWKDPDSGQWRTMEKQFDQRISAIEELPKLELQIRSTNGQFRSGPEMLFSELVAACKKSFYHAATFEGGLKTGGVKSLSTTEAGLKNLTAYFGSKAIGNIDEADLRRYREWRKKLGSQNPSLVKKGIRAEVKPSTINRELTTCRRMFSFALEKGLITRDIFRNAKAIHKKLEEPRTRILTHHEIDRLLAACSDSRIETFSRRRRAACKDKSTDFDQLRHEVAATNLFMKPAILLAADSGLRKGEILSLRWSDVDLSSRRVRIRREVTKTEKGRTEGLTKRTVEALEEILQFKSTAVPDPFVFISALNDNRPMSNITRPWNKVKKLADLEDIKFHDLRRTAATILVRDLGLGVEFAAKLLGHSEGSQITLRHYVAADDAAIETVVSGLDELHRRQASIEVSNAEN